MEDFLVKLALSAPAAAAVIACVMLFLKHLREERISRDTAQARFLSAMEKLSTPIHELSAEVRLLREQHSESKSAARRT